MYCLQYSENVYLIIVDGDGMQILNTKGLNRSNSAINAHTIKGTSLAWKLLRRNSVRPEEKNMKQLLEAFKKKIKAIRVESKILNSNVFATLLLFWISASSRIRAYEKVWACKILC